MKRVAVARWLAVGIWVGALGLSAGASAAQLSVLSSAGEPLATVMITRTLVHKPQQDLSDNGYAPHGVTNQSAVELTRFTSAAGRAHFPHAQGQRPVNYRLRKPGYRDVQLLAKLEGEVLSVVMEAESDPLVQTQLQPANTWLSALDFDGDEKLKKHFQLNCAFCHQQGSPVMRVDRSESQWLEIIKRMGGYGARVADDDRQALAQHLSKGYQKLHDNPELVPAPRAWDTDLSDAEITEWPIGDGFSQMHDFLIHPNGFIYVGDNLFDRIYEVNPETGEYTVYKVPHDEDMKLGGILGNRFTNFPKMENYMGVHSFAVSPSDGHIFITPSMQQALIEFDPVSKEFITHKMDEGFYPHTIRADENDRIWFTLALSSKIGMWERAKGEFRVYDLPARSVKEWAIIKALPLILSFAPDSRPEPSVDRQSTGIPMPYGIDVAPDGRVWFARLYGNDIGYIDPETDSVTMIKTPFNGPRRLRVDAEGNIWIVAFQDSQIVKYNPQARSWQHYDLPVANELPYSLNVDRERGTVWVNGNQSDTILSFDIATEQWQVYPMPRRRTFTRDIEVAEDGSVYTSNSHFPSWQIEGGQPTLIRIRPQEKSQHAVGMKEPSADKKMQSTSESEVAVK